MDLLPDRVELDLVRAPEGQDVLHLRYRILTPEG
jgi:hypothetical protein